MNTKALETKKFLIYFTSVKYMKTSKNKELWSQYHIAGFSYNNTYVTPYAKCHYTAEYNTLN